MKGKERQNREGEGVNVTEILYSWRDDYLWASPKRPRELLLLSGQSSQGEIILDGSLCSVDSIGQCPLMMERCYSFERGIKNVFWGRWWEAIGPFVSWHSVQHISVFSNYSSRRTQGPAQADWDSREMGTILKSLVSQWRTKTWEWGTLLTKEVGIEERGPWIEEDETTKDTLGNKI